MRKLLLLALFAICASAQSPLSRILSGELDRNFGVLKEKGDPAPYFMGYSVSYAESAAISASDGAISSDSHNRSRLLDNSGPIRDPAGTIRATVVAVLASGSRSRW